MTPRQPQAPKARTRGVRVVEARRLLLKLPNVTEGRSYGMPLATISERDVLMELDPHAFFFTEHYRNYPAVLVRLAEVARPLLIDVVTEAWRHVASLPPPRPRKKPTRGRKRGERSRGPAAAQQALEADGRPSF